MNKEEILQKAQLILSEEEQERVCLKAGVCPKCGGTNLKRKFCDIEGHSYIAGCNDCHKL